MLRKGIIGDFFIFRDFLSEEGWQLECLIEGLELDICENDTSIQSLIFIEFPDLAVSMTIFIADLHDIRMSDHDEEGDSIWYLPLILVSHIGF